MPGVHAMLSASGANRWLSCTPSARLEQDFPESTSTYAEEGTLAHSLGELLLRKHFTVMKPSAFKKELAAIQKDSLYTPAMLEYCEGYRDFVIECYNEMGAQTIAIEQKLDFTGFVPEGHGTGDVILIGDDAIQIIDLKYGSGVPVSAENNPQIMLYGLGALLAFEMIYDIERIIMSIYQPRLDSISHFTMHKDALYAWAESIKPIAEQAFEGEGEFNAGDHCKYCKAKALCRARAEANLDAAKYDFKKPEILEDEEIGEILRLAGQLKSWVSDVESFALEQVRDHGKHYDGWKLVEGRAVRVYKDQDSVMDTLVLAGFDKALITETNLLGITKMEKAIGKKRFAELLANLIDKPAGKPTLVPEDDNRPEINSTASAIEDFKEEN